MKRFLLCTVLLFLLSMGVTSAWAHDATFNYHLDINPDFVLGDISTIEHMDMDEGYGYKGTLTLTITNI